MVSQPSIFTSALPDHTQLPESDGTFVQNFQEHPQSVLLTDSIRPRLKNLHPDGHYAIGQDCGIYWRLTEPPERGAEAPDWFYVPDVTPLPPGPYRRSYVLWQELIPPLIVLEFASGDGSEERDVTPYTGKFWIYERVIRLPTTASTRSKKPPSNSTNWWRAATGNCRPTRAATFRLR
nr:Uma2 family endonuclease [Gloeobacter morelensis]